MTGDDAVTREPRSSHAPSSAPDGDRRSGGGVMARATSAARPPTPGDRQPADLSGSGRVAAALEAMFRARAPSAHATTPLVRQLAARVSRKLAFDAATAELLDVSVRVRDVGMVGLPDAVVLATAPLSPADWELVNRHPAIAAELLEGLPDVAAAAPIVRAHHERWDGGGYPDGLRGERIPLLSRVIATCDAFVAMASDRPHRLGVGADAALEHISRQRSSQFDPQMVDALIDTLTANGSPRPAARRATGARTGSRRRASVPGAPAQRPDMGSAIAEFDVIPAFAPAHERVLKATAAPGPVSGELVAAIESDTGLTIAVLRRAQTAGAQRPIANVADAVAALTPAVIEQAFISLPLARFPWRTTPLEVMLHPLRLHAQAVTRAADRIVREVNPGQRDDVLVAALLHDIGKLLLSGVVAEPESIGRSGTPEERVRHEQQVVGMDHASAGGLMVERWKLPKVLAGNIAAHHRSEAESQVATYVRLADMLAHHAVGDPVDRRKMLRLANVCGLSPHALRDVMFDLPHSEGSQRRRAKPSPLSNRETDILRILAQGKVYKEIALALGLQTSTIRTHLHNAYGKLEVHDRAQAVLRATEMGWL